MSPPIAFMNLWLHCILQPHAESSSNQPAASGSNSNTTIALCYYNTQPINLVYWYARKTAKKFGAPSPHIQRERTGFYCRRRYNTVPRPTTTSAKLPLPCQSKRHLLYICCNTNPSYAYVSILAAVNGSSRPIAHRCVPRLAHVSQQHSNNGSKIKHYGRFHYRQLAICQYIFQYYNMNNSATKKAHI